MWFPVWNGALLNKFLSCVNLGITAIRASTPLQTGDHIGLMVCEIDHHTLLSVLRTIDIE